MMKRTNDDHDLLNAILRNDFLSFLQRCMATLNPGMPFLLNWHLQAIAYQLERVRRGEVTRLIINLPPRYLKSLMVSVAFPAFLLGHQPQRRIFGISYGAELASKHANDSRSITQSPWFPRTFPKSRIIKATETDIITSQRGFRKTTSVYSAITGLGGDMFIIDDPQKPIDAQSESLRNQLIIWFSNTLLSRLDNKATGVIIIVMQRVHQYDLTGFLIENSNDWTVLSLPAIAEHDEDIPIGDDITYHRRAGEALHPAYESLLVLEKLRAEMGSDVFAAQYQQSPVPPGGAMIRRSWLRYYDTLPGRTNRMKIIQSWDTAAKAGAQNDWSVCTTWLVVDRKDFYLIDLTRGRYEYPELRAKALALAEKYKPNNILIEDASVGTALAQELKSGRRFNLRLIPVDRDKVGRLYVQQDKFERGSVLFPQRASFLPVLEAELLSFPQSKTDDQVDSISQALAFKSGSYDTSFDWV
jgi:predicted phage terminase large subunit-like protein